MERGIDMRSARSFAALVCVSTVLGGLATAGTAAGAARPVNDTIGFAKVVPSLPLSHRVDTTGATNGPFDAQLNKSNPSCANPVGPVLFNSVWYKFTAGTEGGLLVNAGDSSYLVAIEIATGTPGALTAVTCGPFSASIATVPGTTYYVNAFDPFGGGGTLKIDFRVGPALHFTASQVILGRSGAATITFAYTCTNASSADGLITLTQPVGRVAVDGSERFFDEANCDGTQHAWSTSLSPSNGKFAGGKAVLTADLEACDDQFFCTSAPTLTQTFQLRRSGG